MQALVCPLRVLENSDALYTHFSCMCSLRRAGLANDQREALSVGHEEYEKEGVHEEVMGEDSRRQVGSRRGAAHVLLLLHLIRGADNFCVSFDTRWECAFVDSVGDGAGWGESGQGKVSSRECGQESVIHAVDHDGMPSAVQAAGKTILDVVRGLNPAQVSKPRKPCVCANEVSCN